ncbi:hypothetical protein ABEP16_13135 [Priestia aryabhattai]|uniref:hypothetical protein n=1 Tax=Priestia aryabhattai TaxID=412384 RepID=UPI003D285BDE
MKIDELNLSKRSIQGISQHFETVEKLVEFYLKHGRLALQKRCNLGYKTIRDKLLPQLNELGYIAPSWEQKEMEIGCKLLTAHQVEKELGIHLRSLPKIFESGHITDKDYFIVGEEINAPSYQKYAFREDKIKSLKSKYNSTLTNIAAELGVAMDSVSYLLNRYLSKEEFREASLTAKRWNRSWVVANWGTILERAERYHIPKESDYGELIGTELTELIDNYITYRLENDEIEVLGISYTKNKMRKTTVKTHQKFLVNCLYKIKCNIAQIPNYWFREVLAFRRLTLEEKEQVKKVSYDAFHFNKQDSEAITKGVNSEYKRWRQIKDLRPFLMYVLMLREEDYNKKLEKSLDEDLANFDSQKEWAKLKIAHTRIQKALKHKISVSRPKPSYKRGKIFASRQQLVNCINAVEKNLHIVSPLKHATQLMMGFFSGIRPIELANLRIDMHLDIEDNVTHPDFGFMKRYIFKINNRGEAIMERTSIDDLNGWSRIWITEDIAKGGYSPSPSYGTLLVPRATERLNDYLKWLYKQNNAAKGKGFLFRPSDLHPFDPYSTAKIMTEWISKYRKRMFEGIFTDSEIETFTYYVTRRTVSNLIAKRTYISEQQINEWRLRVAELHCRHGIENEEELFLTPKGKTNEDYYQEDVPLRMYYSVLKHALDFPFDEVELLEWEKKNNPIGVMDFNAKIDKALLNKEEELFPPNDQHDVPSTTVENINEKLNDLHENLNLLRKQSTAAKAGYKGKARLEKIS